MAAHIPGGLGFFKRSILPLLRNRISLAWNSSKVDGSASSLEMNESPGVSISTIFCESTSRMTS